MCLGECRVFATVQPLKPTTEKQADAMAGWGGGGGGGGGGLGSIGFGELLVHVAVFMLSGPALIMLQKYVLDIMTFEYPISIVAVGTVARWILMLVLVHTGLVSLGNYKNMTFVDWTQGMLPVGVLECISLATGTTAYLRLSLSFVQMLKAFEPVVLNLLIVALGLESFSLHMFACIIVVCIGSILAAIGEVDFDTWGVVLMCMSELAEVRRREWGGGHVMDCGPFDILRNLSIHAWATPARTSSGLRAWCCVVLGGRGGDGIERET